VALPGNCSFVLSEAVLVLVIVIDVPGITANRKIAYEYDYEHEHEKTELAGKAPRRAKDPRTTMSENCQRDAKT